jgi:hypothetical protein
LRRHTRPQSWQELYELLNDTLDPRKHKDTFELFGRIFALSQYPVIGPAPADRSAIQMDRLIRDGEFAYFCLPALGAAMTSISVAKFAIFCFIDAARRWNTSGAPIKKPFLFIDESQVVCGTQNIARVCQQATGAKVRLVFSQQSLTDSITRDAPKIASTIRTNTRVKLAFGVVDRDERDEWISTSGEQIGHLFSYSNGRDGEGRATCNTTMQEVLHNRLNHNVINAVNNTPGAALLHVNRDEGLSQFKAVPHQIWCPYPMEKAEYERYLVTPWPDAPESQVQGSEPQKTFVNQQGPDEIMEQGMQKYAALEELFRNAVKKSGRRAVEAATAT